MATRFDRKGYQRSMGKCTGTRKYPNGRVGRCDHPSHGCFPGEVRVLTPDGDLPIGCLKDGDTILAFDENQAELVPSRIKRTRRYEAGAVIAIHFGGQISPLRTTGTHTLLVCDRGWVKANEIKVGDRLLMLSQSSHESPPVTGISTCCVEPVFNIIVERNFTFVVDAGFAAHSFTLARSLRVTLHRAWEWCRSLKKLYGHVISPNALAPLRRLPAALGL
jgi:hypothetical protein